MSKLNRTEARNYRVSDSEKKVSWTNESYGPYAQK